MDAVAPPLAARRVVAVGQNVQIARDTYRIRLEDAELARAILPGQFVMIRSATGSEPLLGRPFALYDVVRDANGIPTAIDVIYLVLGSGTAALARVRAGDHVRVWGPRGNGFGPSPGGDVVFVAGGIGQTPFLALGRWWTGHDDYGTNPMEQTPTRSATLLYGVRSRDLVAGVEDFTNTGISVELASDDGTVGHHGYVTDLLADRLKRGDRPTRVIGCGPPGMLAALTRLTSQHEISCDLSLENHMACGFGVCFSCVAPIRQTDGSVDLRRVCVEGPIFDAQSVVWS